MRDESRGRTGTLVVAIAVVTGLLAMAGPTDGASKQVTVNCPMETTKTARLSASDAASDKVLRVAFAVSSSELACSASLLNPSTLSSSSATS